MKGKGILEDLVPFKPNSLHLPVNTGGLFFIFFIIFLLPGGGVTGQDVGEKHF